MSLRTILKEKGFKESDFCFYGETAAKVLKDNGQKLGKLVLITSTSPTKYGEGKTTLAISLNDALNKLGKSSVVALREPSLGPVFGTKGGACGGGRARVIPEEDINLHFTGDIHAVTTANNLLSAIIDNHIFQGNELNINPDTISHERCLDLNDRSLRTVTIDGRIKHFNISTASEMMAILCMSCDEDDLRRRIDNIFVGYTYDLKEVFVRDLKCTNALLLLLKMAIKPNLVSTLENNLAIVHGGPFANIAHGTNSVVSDFYAIHNFLYTVVEAGFGSDMGGVKFFDILARTYKDLTPCVVVLNTTIQSLKHNGDGDIRKGISNLEYHINNMLRYTNHLIVALNVHDKDEVEDISFVENYVEEKNIPFVLSTGYLEGSSGTFALAEEVLKMAKEPIKDIQFSYDVSDSIEEKVYKFCKETYGAKEVIYSEETREKLELFENSKCRDLPICVAKTQYSISDNAKILGYPKDFTMTVRDIKMFSGAGFITVYFGNILTMPGLTKDANYLHM